MFFLISFGSSLSHPVRVRGLKLTSLFFLRGCDRSHPVRVRGLKRRLIRQYKNPEMVAPRAGAWIETNELPEAS